MTAKKRLDVLVYELGFAESREKAKAIIMSGIIYADNQKADKPGTMYSEDVKIEMRGNKLKYVSRGGLKLEKAVNVFSLDLKDKITMDIGASTGGFTDCMLQNGAKKVYSVACALRRSPVFSCLLRTDCGQLLSEPVINILKNPVSVFFI